jgi:hypothetical protein
VKEIVLQHRSCRAKVRAKPGTDVETRRATSLDGRISAALDAARDERLLLKITALLAALIPAMPDRASLPACSTPSPASTICWRC